MRLGLDDVLTRSAALAERLAARAAEAERLRRLSDETMADLRDSDLLGMVVPTSLGGSGLGLDALAQSTRILARGCPASAWTISFLVMHSWLLAKFPAPARAELFTPDAPWALAPAPLAPTGTAAPADGGYRIAGRWGVCHRTAGAIASGGRPSGAWRPSSPSRPPPSSCRNVGGAAGIRRGRLLSSHCAVGAASGRSSP